MAQASTFGDTLPPSYETVGANTLLGFQDFWPKGTNDKKKVRKAELEHFNCVMQEANRHLSSHPNLAVVSIETIEKKACETKSLDKPLTIFKPSGYNKSDSWVKGLRLWYTRNPGSEAQQIGYKDIEPRCYESTDDEYPVFENFQDLINNFNEEVESNDIIGRVLSIQTVPINLNKATWLGVGCCMPTGFAEWCRVQDEYRHHRVYFLRVFYEQCENHRLEKIGIKDFTPDVLHSPSVLKPKPKTSDFSEVIKKAAKWLETTTVGTVTNFQTVETMGWDGAEDPPTTLTCMDYNIHRDCSVRRSFLRVGYIKVEPKEMPQISSLCYQALYPLHNNNKESGYWETTTQSEQRIISWLQKTDAQLISAETFYQNVKEHSQHPNETRTVYQGDWLYAPNATSYVREPMLQHVRLYMDGVLRPEQSPEQCGYYDEEQRGCTLL